MSEFQRNQNAAKISGDDFHAAITSAKKTHEAGAAVDIEPKDYYNHPKTKLFISPNKTAGAAVSEDGNLTSVFKAKGSTDSIDPVLSEASQHATKLNAFASGNGYLQNLYSKYGFRPVSRLPFDDEMAPKDWNYEKYGRPDVVFMVNDKSGASGAPDISGQYKNFESKIPIHQKYEDSVAAQDSALAKISSQKKIDKAHSDYQELRQRAEKVVPVFESEMRDFATKNGVGFQMAPIKGEDRSVEKILSKHDGDASQINDIVRGSFVAKNREDADKVSNALKSLHDPSQPTKNMWAAGEKANEDGWRGSYFHPRINGMLTEVQVTTPAMIKAEHQTHPLYARIESLERNAKSENRDLRQDEKSEIDSLKKQQQKIFKNAEEPEPPVFARDPDTSKYASVIKAIREQGRSFSGKGRESSGIRLGKWKLKGGDLVSKDLKKHGRDSNTVIGAGE